VSSLDVRAIDASELRNQPCPSTQQEFRIFLTEAAFDRAVARGDNDTTREVGGVLVGELLRDDAGPYLRIDDTIDALHAEEKGAELTFTHATWDHIHKEMDTRHKDKRVVGWYHTHPGFGIFLSDRDQFIHRSFFNLPFQVALVYDPKSREHGVLAWHDNELWRARRYWIGAREQVWDGPRVVSSGPEKLRERAELDARKPGHPGQAGQAGSAEREARGAADAPEASGPPGALAMFIAVGVILALLGGMVGHWLGVDAANQALAEAQIAIVNAKMEGQRSERAMLQSDLLGILRDTYSDEAMHRPLADAVAVLDQIIAALPPDSPAPAAPLPAGAGSAAAGSGAAGSGAAGPGAAVPGAPVPAAAPGNPLSTSFAVQLRTARTRLVQLEQARGTAQAELTALESAARHGNEPSKEITRDLAEQRAGLGAIYAELAADASKADPTRARRLLAAAAHLDPGNRVRYEKQLQTFDPKGHLPIHAPGEGEPR
jgi:proteasome lid subunit RPN8/RPN11